MLIIAGGEAKEECGDDQLCAGFEADIEGGYMRQDKHGWTMKEMSNGDSFSLMLGMHSTRGIVRVSYER